MAYDVASVRGLYTSLSDGWTYLNAHDCPQVPERVSAAVARSFRMATAVAAPEVNAGSHSRRAWGRPEGETFVASARHAVADLVGATAERVVLGPSLPVVYASLVTAMRPLFRYDSSLVVSPLDAPALTAAVRRAPAKVRTAHADLGTGELPAWQYAQLIDGSTRLVTLPAAHSLLGTVAPVSQIVDQVRERSRAWVLVDATAYAPYHAVDFDDWGADAIGIDLGALGGPHLAALVVRDTAMFKRMEALSGDDRVTGAAKLQLDVSPALAGGAAALVDHVADLVPGHAGRATRRARLTRSMEQMTVYLDGLRDDLYTFLGTLPAVHIFGVTGEAASEASTDRLPRLTFGVRGVPSATVYERLFDNGIVTTLTTPQQATPLLAEMGIEEMGGAVTVGLGPFNTEADVEQLIRVVASLA